MNQHEAGAGGMGFFRGVAEEGAPPMLAVRGLGPTEQPHTSALSPPRLAAPRAGGSTFRCAREFATIARHASAAAAIARRLLRVDDAAQRIAARPAAGPPSRPPAGADVRSSCAAAAGRRRGRRPTTTSTTGRTTSWTAPTTSSTTGC